MDRAETFAHQVLPHRFHLAGLHEDVRRRIEIADHIMHPALLAVDGADLIEEAALLLFDLCEIIFLR